MKKYAPYLLVVIVGLILAILIYRWYQTKRPTPQILPEGVSVETLPDEEQTSLVAGVSDYSEVKFKPTGFLKKVVALGVVRYFIDQGKLKLSAITQLPLDKGKNYYLWIKPAGQDKFQKVTQLQPKKGGVLGSAALPAQVLPLKVVISTSNLANQVLDQAVLEATIPKLPEEN